MTWKNNRRKGATSVEFALTAPVLFLLLFGAYELSRANLIRHTAEAAAYEGARVGIVPGATSAEIETAANNVLATIGMKNATVSVEPSNLQTETDTVAVTVRVSFADNSLLASQFVGSAPFVRTCELFREFGAASN